jgi:cell division protein FtsB
VKTLAFVLLAALVLVQHKLWFGQGGMLQLWEQEQAIEAKAQEIQRLKERNIALEAEVVDLKQGLDAIEERARSEMGMIKHNETFYQIIGESIQPES